MSSPKNYPWGSLSFNSIIREYVNLQNQVVSAVKSIAAHSSVATPGKFLLLQFQMAQVTQMGESISNLISQVQAVINQAVRNQKTS